MIAALYVETDGARLLLAGQAGGLVETAREGESECKVAHGAADVAAGH